MKCKYCNGETNRERKPKFKSKASPAKYKFYTCRQCGMHFSVAREGEGEGVVLIGKKAMEWKGSPPVSFPCFVGGCEREGEVQVVYRVGGVIVRVILCEECGGLSVGEIAGLFGNK